MSLHFYGIPNCDTVKKARKWLEARDADYTFHDYKKEGADAARLEAWVANVGWETLLNRAGTTFRKLPEEDKQDLDAARAVAIMVAHPSTIKRPVVEHPGGLLVGFREPEWAATLA
ncbi:ArsC family reductase [Novosphingobium panipatense]|uniref:Transcriptional regulator, Spx/MgsR family n=1 Tax=Novosphingobium panipatense TaxID=428991 RepID=A0ABY1Q7P8_9SPHN|nr:ArsC family reductase [Novosphingobium panipatense]SMP61598.1 transcriptional regulator, Spx/MgsR family [Novosphingobium panipatense]